MIWTEVLSKMSDEIEAAIETLEGQQMKKSLSEGVQLFEVPRVLDIYTSGIFVLNTNLNL
jgi:hypothetical protein